MRGFTLLLTWSLHGFEWFSFHTLLGSLRWAPTKCVIFSPSTTVCRKCVFSPNAYFNWLYSFPSKRYYLHGDQIRLNNVLSISFPREEDIFTSSSPPLHFTANGFIVVLSIPMSIYHQYSYFIIVFRANQLSAGKTPI